MYFEEPKVFLLLLSFPVLYWLLNKAELRTRKVAAIFKSNSPKKSYFITRLSLIFLFLSSLLFIAARPHVEYKQSGDYIFLVDVSRSMEARYSCGELTFLDRSKNIMRNILRSIPEARFNIVAFDRFAFPISPMTFDHAYLNEVIDNGVYVGLYYQATGTEIENAFSVVAQKKTRLPEIYGGVSKVILLSDGYVGGDYRRRMADSLSELRNMGIQIITIGIGNPGETPLMQTEQGRCIDEQLEINGEVVMIPLRDDVLKFIAGETQGQYFAEGEIDNVIELLRNNMQMIESDEDETGAVSGAHGRDITWIFLVIANLALFGLLISGSGLAVVKFWNNAGRTER